MTNQSWNPGLYDSHHRYVSDLSTDLITLLAPQPGETILDLGCGTGILTDKIAHSGAKVWGIDSSPEMIESARKSFQSDNLQFLEGWIGALVFDYPVDAIFSNAALHWVLDPQGAVHNLYNLLRHGGRLVVEFGGKKNIHTILTSMDHLPDPPRNHFYFPGVAEYSSLLELEGFEVHLCRWFPRPTQLADGVNGLGNYIRMYFPWILKDLSPKDQSSLIHSIETYLYPTLWDQDHWIADYCRIQVVAIKP